MSTTEAKRTHAHALADAIAFRELFRDCYERWEVAGSVRRGKPMVADVEHVVIPRVGDVEVMDGLFPTKKTVNLLWHRAERLVADGELRQHIYSYNIGKQPIYRWGPLYRGIDFRGFNHEIFSATPTNWGCILTIRTGSADFSHKFVIAINNGRMYRQQDGQLIHITSGQVVPVPDEETYFKLAGVPFVPPARRG